jgi:PIN domain nuclease of toxin-antitoxin system
MESIVHLDTHIIVWLYSGSIELLSERAKSTLEDSALVISPMVLLELFYLKETNRLNADPHDMVNDLRDRIGLAMDSTAMPLVIDQALHLSWTRDPFDRLITAQAASYDRYLLTKDATIREHYPKAIW